ncbi:hypothetical protein K523DRAFT_74569 [Schizophyllum commune Tattone D]|nr:hypothetical protein K523DRAFT_74569 [Schizophyllum commune Tattone D]
MKRTIPRTHRPSSSPPWPSLYQDPMRTQWRIIPNPNPSRGSHADIAPPYSATAVNC